MTVVGSALFHLTISAGAGLFEAPSEEDWLYLGLVAICTAAAFIGLIGGLRLIRAVESALLLAVEPVAAAILAAIFLYEVLSGLAAGRRSACGSGHSAASGYRRPRGRCGNGRRSGAGLRLPG